MLKALTHLPVLDPAAFQAAASEWKHHLAKAKPGGDRVIVEWGVGRGPSCLVFPVGNRGAGLDLTKDNPHTQSDERWADFLEFEFVPQVEQALKTAGLKYTVICADLRPVQIMRERLRAQQAAANAKTGHTAHH